jgi:hypothetical protein
MAMRIGWRKRGWRDHGPSATLSFDMESSTASPRLPVAGLPQHDVARLLGFVGMSTILELAKACGLVVPRDVVKAAIVRELAGRPSLTLEGLLAERLPRRDLERAARRLDVAFRGVARAELAARLLHAVRGWRPFAEARAFARSLGLRDREAWARYCRSPGELPPLPVDVPLRPDEAYFEAGWRDFADWLAAPRRGAAGPSHASDEGECESERFWPFARARAFMHELKLLDIGEWRAYCRGDLARLKGERPDHIPAAPNVIYATEGWRSWRDWLGTDWLAELAPGWRPFKKARRFVWGLGLASVRAWREYARSDARPTNLPKAPDRVYGAAWRGWHNWLGTPGGSRADARYRPFEDARSFVRSLGLDGFKAWRAYCRGDLAGLEPKPTDIPANPSALYSTQGWKGFGDWLGTGHVATYERSYRPFEDARAFARSLGLTTEDEWREYTRGERPDLAPLPRDVPANPRRRYRGEGWSGYVDWLRTQLPTPTWRRFDAARAHARALKLGSRAEWLAYCDDALPEKGSLPSDIPREPQHVYWGQGWKDFADWLGPENLHLASGSRHAFRSYEQARRWAQEVGIRSANEWRRVCGGEDALGRALPDDVPAHPHRTYAGFGWKGWGEFLGTGVVATFLREYRLFRSARAYVRGLRLRNTAEWRAFCRGELPERGRLPDDIPATPNNIYAERGWVDFFDWLGSDGSRARAERRTFAEARVFARSLGLRTNKEWFAFAHGERPDLGELPADMPIAPAATYWERGWTTWGDFLGADHRPFAEARRYARTLGLESLKAWKAFARGERPDRGALPNDVPKNPHYVYRDTGWKGWGDFLGTGNTRGGRKGSFRSFEDARAFVHTLGIRSHLEWIAYATSGRKPKDVPSGPTGVYAKEWRGWRDWLGTTPP